MKFNFSLKGRNRTDTRYAVVPSRLPDAPGALYTALLSGCLSPDEGLNERSRKARAAIRALIRENDPAFVAGLALRFREKPAFRPLAWLLTAELAVQAGNSEWAGQLVAQVVKQPGEIPAWLEQYARAKEPAKDQPKETSDPIARAEPVRAAFIRPERAVRKALAILFNTLDEYQFTRYDRETQTGLRQALTLLRPKPKDKPRQLLFHKIRKDQLPPRSNWQDELNVLQQQHYDSPELRQLALRDKWKELISSFRMGYPALLDNLRPILSTGVSGKMLKLTAEYLGNAAAVVRSGQGPFPFLEAYRELRDREEGGSVLLMEALEQAVLHSAWNIAGFEEELRVVIAMDVSDSMKYPVREDSRVQRYDIGPLLAMVLRHRCRQVSAGILGNTWKPVDLSTRQVLAGADAFQRREGEAGYATNGHLVIADLLKKDVAVDKVLIFTDCALWNDRPFNQPAGMDLRRLWRQYRQRNPEAKLYLFDLAGYGKKPLEIPEEGVYLVSGWNERIFDVLSFHQSVNRG